MIRVSALVWLIAFVTFTAGAFGGVHAILRVAVALGSALAAVGGWHALEGVARTRMRRGPPC